MPNTTWWQHCYTTQCPVLEPALPQIGEQAAGLLLQSCSPKGVPYSRELMPLSAVICPQPPSLVNGLAGPVVPDQDGAVLKGSCQAASRRRPAAAHAAVAGLVKRKVLLVAWAV